MTNAEHALITLKRHLTALKRYFVEHSQVPWHTGETDHYIWGSTCRV